MSVCQPASATEQPLEPEVVMVKKESLEEELTGCSVPEEERQAAPTTTGSMYESVYNTHPTRRRQTDTWDMRRYSWRERERINMCCSCAENKLNGGFQDVSPGFYSIK